MKLDRKGVMGFPLRLAVTFLILAIFVPVAINMMEGFEDDSSASAAKAEADKIVDAVRGTYYSGSGSIQRVSVSLMPDACLVLGGEGSDSYCITILVNENVAEKLFLERPSVKFLGEPVSITGNSSISIECVIDNGTYGVVVSYD